MVNFLLGQQSGFTKYPCFLCVWDSRDRSQHYTKKDWPAQNEMVPGRFNNIVNNLLVDRHKILFPLLHIKIGLIKQFTKPWTKMVAASLTCAMFFQDYLLKNWKGGIFDGSQVRQLITVEILSLRSQ